MDTALKDAIVREIESLPEGREADALKAIRALGTGARTGTTGAALLQSYGTISSDDARQMLQVIEEECERIGAEVR